MLLQDFTSSDDDLVRYWTRGALNDSRDLFWTIGVVLDEQIVPRCKETMCSGFSLCHDSPSVSVAFAALLISHLAEEGQK